MQESRYVLYQNCMNAYLKLVKMNALFIVFHVKYNNVVINTIQLIAIYNVLKLLQLGLLSHLNVCFNRTTFNLF